MVCSMRPDEAEMGWCVLNVSEWSGEGRKEKVWVHGAGEAHLGSSSFHCFTVKGHRVLGQFWTCQRTKPNNRGWGADLDSVFYLDSEFSGNGHLEVTEDTNSCWNVLGWRKVGRKFLEKNKNNKNIPCHGLKAGPKCQQISLNISKYDLFFFLITYCL